VTDYLWDRTGPADPDVVELEKLLAPLGQPVPPPALRLRAPRASRAFAGIFAAAAALIVVLASAVWRTLPHERGQWDVVRVSGSPVIASRPLGDRVKVDDGSWLETRGGDRATITVGDIGQVQVEPDSRIGLMQARPGDYRLQLDRGTMHAMIWSPPGQFLVETPSASALDLGCAYTMTVDPDGTGVIEVTSGWVGFEWKGRESFIPEGAVCRTRPGRGPGTPYFQDARDAIGADVDVIDNPASSRADRSAALARVLARARPRDALTLWHLLPRVGEAERDAVFDRLAAFVPPPAGVTRDGIRLGQREMLDRWWDNLGLQSVNWWRLWEQKWRQNRAGR
jgi:hypothetical protein